MPAFRDLTGQRFGHLTVLSLSRMDARQGAYWRCRCDCGAQAVVRGASLSSGGTRTCGCYLAHWKDISGQRFGRLTALEVVVGAKRSGTSLIWLCRCDCGHEVRVNRDSLLSLLTRSCGCLRDEAQERNGETGKARLLRWHAENYQSVTGRRFGRLVVTGETGQRRNNSRLLECRCDCGGTVVTTRACLVAGDTRSCGCLAREASRRTVLIARAARKAKAGA
jgi:hypothetical protein